LTKRIVANEAKIGDTPGVARKAIDPAPLVRAMVKRFVDDPGLSDNRPCCPVRGLLCNSPQAAQSIRAIRDVRRRR
jgi:hypothetical protein